MYEIKELKTKEIGYPKTPSKWTKEPTYQKISGITVTTGNGIGACTYNEYVYRIDEIPTGQLNPYTRIDGKPILINTDHIISIVNFTLVTVEFITLNGVYFDVQREYEKDPESTYEKYGKECTVRYLVEDGVEVELVEKFMGNS